MLTAPTLRANLRVEELTSSVALKVEQVRQIGGGGDFPDYEGSYTVIPAIDAQVLPTRNRTMRNDMTVTAIPYTETSNLSGGYTAIIGGN